MSSEGLKPAVRKNFQSLKAVVSWFLPSEEEAGTLPFENRRRRLSDLEPGLDSFLSGIGPFPSSGVPRLPGSVPATWGGHEAGALSATSLLEPVCAICSSAAGGLPSMHTALPSVPRMRTACGVHPDHPSAIDRQAGSPAGPLLGYTVGSWAT